jgi:hypothetical protein
MNIYRSFEQWKNGGFLEHGAPRTEEYTAEELHLVEMGWNYGYDAGRAVEQALYKMAENARELGLSYEQQPTGKQSLQVAPSIVDAYCAAWEQSFLADNPFDTVHLTDALKKHVEAGLKAALAKATGETK